MKTSMTSIGAVLLFLAVLATSAYAEIPEATSGPVIGTFDSRAIAVAYYRSAEFMETIDGWKDQLEVALAAGDSTLADSLEELGEAQQELMHSQVFSTRDIEEILWLIYNDFPVVAEEAGVHLIVNIWDVVYCAEGMEFVNITDMLVAYFDPDEETLEIINAIKGVPAIPMQFMEDIE